MGITLDKIKQDQKSGKLAVEILNIIKKVILLAYGEKTADG